MNTGSWSTGVAILCLGVIALAIFATTSVFYGIESAYYRWKNRRQNAKDEKL
jgi:hypothetical protein